MCILTLFSMCTTHSITGLEGRVKCIAVARTIVVNTQIQGSASSVQIADPTVLSHSLLVIIRPSCTAHEECCP